MIWFRTAALLLIGATSTISVFGQQREVERPTGGAVNFLLPIEADPILQHSKEIYVKNGCAYCHGVDLKVRNGEAADLMHSAIVGADVNANIMGPLLRNGIPQTAKLSPMPQFKDLSDKNIEDISRWIHFARQRGRFEELKSPDGTAGDAAAGKAAFQKDCSSCHTPSALVAVIGRYPVSEQRTRMLKPAAFSGVESFKLEDLHNEAKRKGQERHAVLLENTTQSSVSNLLAYLSTLK